jgi:hypothetical protein
MKKRSFTKFNYFTKSLWVLLLIVGLNGNAQAQTTLGLGDVAFVAYQSDTPDIFAFVLLKDVTAGTDISFTDHGWFAVGGFRDTENECTLTFTTAVSCGTVVSVSQNTPTTASDGNGTIIADVSGTLPSLSTGGDQIFAWQGTAPVAGDESNFVAAIHMNGTWDGDATSSNTSAQPSVFTDGVNSVSFDPEVDNAEYNCATTSGDAATVGAAVNTSANWTTSNSAFLTFPINTCSYSISGCGVTPPVMCEADAGSPQPAGPLTICEGEDTPEFSVVYTPGVNTDPNGGGSVPDPIITELRIDQPGADDDEYIEIFGVPGTDLSPYTLLVIGDGPNGALDDDVSLAGQTIPASGYFVMAMSTFTLGTADYVTSLNFENSDNLTFLLVEGYTGGDDVDTDDDGTLDNPLWTNVVDGFSLIETPGSGDAVYASQLGLPDVGPDGTFVPGHIFFDGVWNIGQFDPVGGLDTPGSGALAPPTIPSYSYIWIVTDGAPNYNAVAAAEGGPGAPYAATFSGLAPGTYCVHGFSFLGSFAQFAALGYTNGVDIANDIANEVICGDLIVADCIGLTVLEGPDADAGADQIVCEGDQIFLGAIANGTGSWSGGLGTFADASSTTTTYTPDATEVGTTVVLTWTTDDPDGAGGCTEATDDVAITIVGAADAEFSYDAAEYCPNGTDPVLSHITGVDGIYTYIVVSGGPTLDLNAETGAINLAGSDQGTYDVTNTVSGCGNLVISGVIDGPETGGLPKAIEFTAVEDIPDLSVYGFGSANNGGGTDGIEFTFPADALNQGDHIWVATESLTFETFFGFAPSYVDNFAASINGDDAIELFCNGQVIDVFGEIDVDGSGQPWEYQDGWAYRNSSTGPDGPSFQIGNWTFSGTNGLEGGTGTNASANVPAPIGTFFSTVGGVCPDDSFTQTIIIQDVEPPVITCPEDILITLLPGLCRTLVTFDVTATDNCDPNPVISQIGGDLGSGDQFDIGEYTLEYEASDMFGNSSTCSFNVTIEEFPNPTETLTCNDLVQVSLDADGESQVGADMILEGGPYGCYEDYIVSIEGGDDLVDCDDIGSELTVMVTDPDTDNKCWGTIIVEDKLAPVFDCPTAPIQIGCAEDPAFVPAPFAFDNCTLVDVQLVEEEWTDEDECDDNTVVLERTWLAIDQYGNESELCTQVINIVRNDVVDFPNDIIWECTQYDEYPTITAATGLHPVVKVLEVGTDVIDATDVTGIPLQTTGSGIPGGVDGVYCSYVYTHADEVITDCGNAFKIIRTWTVIDWCSGQIVTGNDQGEDNVQIIKVSDTTPPAITMAPFTLSANIQGDHPQPCKSQGFIPAPNVSDECSGFEIRMILLQLQYVMKLPM